MKRLLTALICTAAITAHAGLIVVDHAGSGDYTTISDAANASAAGDTVLVKDGTYDQMVVIRNAGTADNPVVYRSENKHGAAVQRFAVIADHIRIEDFEVTGTTLDGIYCAKYFARITGNHVHDVGGYGISAGKYAYVAYNLVERMKRGVSVGDHSLMEYNRVFDIVEDSDWQVLTYFYGDSVTIRCNLLWNDTTAADFTRTHDPARDFVFENNRCFNANHGSESEPSTKGEQIRFTYRNNLFVNTYYNGMWIKDGIRQIRAVNNTFVNAGTYTIMLQNQYESGNTVYNNIMYYYGDRMYGGKGDPAGCVNGPGVYPAETDYNLWYGTPHAYANTAPSEPLNENGMNVDPLFIKLPAAGSDAFWMYDVADTSEWDLHLQAGSPALNAGTETGLTYDLDWNVRPDDGNAPDLGAYEHNSVPGPVREVTVPTSSVRMVDAAREVPRVRLYPLPVRDQLTVSGSGMQGELRILDGAGHTVWQGMVNGSSHSVYVPQGLSAGRYYLSVADGAGVVPFCVIR